MLFTRFFEMVASCGPAARSVEFVFDDKPEIVNYAQTVHKTITGAIKNSHADMFLDGLSFVPDEKSPPVQAADLLMYEWRKRISDVHLRPDRPERPWFPRMRAARPDGQLWRYGRSVFEEALRDQDQSATWARAVMRGDPTDRD